uniref:transketolase n=1 Tax=Eucampia antarctica TaxID=49252 RepID=A0A7S2SBN7_9STRA|mmetsp:Transcript_5938/g.5538  ORF Transcript_5938/g.5538 Transcript_5938/m.5538 type:complete len:711 (+) Transcript_5938:527-2659(+)|eukprot:CAMPEP_0197829050 /NCGR_PEP_ID=MMETSP1437-20131217/5514_1 /TAXON_ID=49252 ORGANISM="Eucampia antarctica, Strain CCMP1452" /NCGR_SAMPLE_ID=MMETSP1437 /ASSEMBLY_ACC=CAM_ASM_001096 /LENGTH=710 /DNA_ID=CAMNT_0043430527 /DNA_START=68 /DNA_END=2200 /DNA_ORIENTATION=-
MKFCMLAIAATALTAGVNGFAVNTGRNFAIRNTNALKMSSAVETDNMAALATAANEARGLAMDSIAAAHSGHMGLPLGAAEVGAVLYGSQMQYNPSDPTWMNRDRFILSAGHGSMFLYSWLNLAGFDLPIEELKNFRQHHSATPGHPEFPNSEHSTPGIESTTGPLGQGLANGVGFAASEKMAEAVFNTDEHKIFGHHIFALAGDGCFQEGVSAESAAFAAHEKLDNLIVLYDANEVTLDKMAEYTQSEDIVARYEAYGWEVYDIDGHDLAVVEETIAAAKASNNGKPKLIKCNTIIGKGMEETEGTNAAHGEAGIPYVDTAKKNIGLPADEKWFVSEGTRDFFKDVQAKNKGIYDEWQETYAAWGEANPELAKQLVDAIEDNVMPAEEMFEKIPALEAGDEATRVSGNTVIQHIAELCPNYISGSADLHGSCRNYINDGGNYGAGFDKSYAGKNFYFGIREHSMGSILNGIAYHGIFKASGSTFAVFVDYFRPTIRVAALAELNRVSWILTHDSIGVGEDGPTHQPVETVSGIRTFPNVDVYRPADAEETVAAMVSSVTRKEGPTALIFSRQNLVQNNDVDYMARREGALKGAYIGKKETEDLDLIVIATGSEVQHALEAAKDMPGARVVSMPCMEAFERQSDEYKESVLPAACTKRIAMEAGISGLWYKYASKVVGVDRFGFSAPGDIVMTELGMTAENLKKEIESMN